MNPVKLIFRLISEFSLMDDEDYAKYRDESQVWWDSIRIDNEIKEKDKDWKYKLKKKTSVWYIAVGIALLYFPLKRWLSDLVSDDHDEELDD
ncbi:MAG: hypothetical protein JXB49_30060 [Bacteroidales bacterium]|nr:hypothetical protein [Bacteroidales bacterium]